MISWKQYLRSEEKPAAMVDALLKTVHLLLEALRLHAVEGDQFEYEKFQADMQKLHDSLGERPTSAEILVTTGAAIKGVEEYNRHASRFLKQQGLEYQAMMGMLAEAVATISKGSEDTVTRLQTIEKQIERTAVIEDIRLLKAKLGDCLGALRQESRLQQEGTAKTIRSVRKEIDQSKERLVGPVAERTEPPEPPIDSVRGSNGRQDAIAAITQSLDGERHVFAVAFVVQRLALINGRFGPGAGESMMAAFTQHLNEKLSAYDARFRWNETAVLAVIERSEPLDAVNAEVRRATSGRMEALLQAASRSVMLPISVTSMVVPISNGERVEEIVRRLDRFAGDLAGAA